MAIKVVKGDTRANTLLATITCLPQTYCNMLGLYPPSSELKFKAGVKVSYCIILIRLCVHLIPAFDKINGSNARRHCAHTFNNWNYVISLHQMPLYFRSHTYMATKVQTLLVRQIKCWDKSWSWCQQWCPWVNRVS